MYLDEWNPESEGENGYPSQPRVTTLSVEKGWGSRKSIKDLGREEDAIQGNSVTGEEVTGRVGIIESDTRGKDIFSHNSSKSDTRDDQSAFPRCRRYLYPRQGGPTSSHRWEPQWHCRQPPPGWSPPRLNHPRATRMRPPWRV